MIDKQLLDFFDHEKVKLIVSKANDELVLRYALAETENKFLSCEVRF